MLDDITDLSEKSILFESRIWSARLHALAEFIGFRCPAAWCLLCKICDGNVTFCYRPSTRIIYGRIRHCFSGLYCGPPSRTISITFLRFFSAVLVSVDCRAYVFTLHCMPITLYIELYCEVTTLWAGAGTRETA